jgi:hypothetical protein
MFVAASFADPLRTRALRTAHCALNNDKRPIMWFDCDI